jgi:hypothetical protein
VKTITRIEIKIQRYRNVHISKSTW